mgnify:CR=1 FL=1
MVSISLWRGVVSFTIVWRVFMIIFPSLCLLLNMKRREDMFLILFPSVYFGLGRFFDY